MAPMHDSIAYFQKNIVVYFIKQWLLVHGLDTESGYSTPYTVLDVLCLELQCVRGLGTKLEP